jgi:hypothetical protein
MFSTIPHIMKISFHTSEYCLATQCREKKLDFPLNFQQALLVFYLFHCFRLLEKKTTCLV